MIPVYGFLEGDTIGLLVLAEPHDTAASLIAKLQSAASVRAMPLADPVLVLRGTEVATTATAAELGLEPLERIDVRGRRS